MGRCANSSRAGPAMRPTAALDDRRAREGLGTGEGTGITYPTEARLTPRSPRVGTAGMRATVRQRTDVPKWLSGEARVSRTAPLVGRGGDGGRGARRSAEVGPRGAPMDEPRPRVRTEPSRKRVRIVFDGSVVVDTDDALYVWENPNYPQFYVPRDAVAPGLLVPTGTVTRSPSRGPAVHFTVRAGGREAVDAAWCHADSPVEELRDRVRFDFDAMDAWFEEDEEIFVHPRSPETRIAILASSRHVVVAGGGVVVAETRRP